MPWREECVLEAAAIGDRLAATAVRSGGQAGWVTRNVLYVGETDALDQLPRLSSSNPGVYSGTAGMAVFYARLFRLTDDRRHRDLAVACMEHAGRNAFYINDRKAGRLGAEYRFGHYFGTLGVAWAAHEVHRLTGAHDGLSARLVAAVQGTLHLPGQVDLINGAAGGLLDMLALRGEVAGAEDVARALAESLLSRAVPDAASGGVSWGDRHLAGGHNLTGFSHGNAGIAYALASAWVALGDARLAEAADAALRYEDHHFQPDLDNWPNFQLDPGEDGRTPCSVMWCHGAPGIGMGRALLMGVHPRFARRRDVEAALRTTRRSLEPALREPGLDFMVCHGVAGLVESAWRMKDALDPGSGRRAAEAAMRLAQQRHGREAYGRWGPEAEWPSAATVGPHPALVTGTAGVGHLFLQLADERVPTVAAPAQLMAV